MRKSDKYMIGAIVLCLSIFLFAYESHAASQDPPFSTSFTGPQGTVASGWTDATSPFAYWGGGECYGTCTHTWVNVPSITSAANNPLGTGNGFRSWLYGDGLTVAAYDINISNYSNNFSPAQKELWIRWYVRYQSGIIGTGLYYQKLLYIRTASSNSVDVIAELYNKGGFCINAQATANPVAASSTTGGWNTMYPTAISDGTWHCLEIHIKMDTNGTVGGLTANGIAQYWLDGVNYINNTSVNFSNGDTVAQQGWTWFDFPGNYSYGSSTPGLNTSGNEMYMDWDDLDVVNITPAGRDASGNAMIGPLGGTVNLPPATPTGVTVQILP